MSKSVLDSHKPLRNQQLISQNPFGINQTTLMCGHSLCDKHVSLRRIFLSTTYSAATASSSTHSFTYSRLDLKINLPSSSSLYVGALVHRLRLETKWNDQRNVIICELSVIQPNSVSLSSECWRHLCAKPRMHWNFRKAKARTSAESAPTPIQMTIYHNNLQMFEN